MFELLYGGARGGGKTDAGIMWLLTDDYYTHPMYRALVIRRNADDLYDWIDRAYEKYKPLGAKKVGNPAIFMFPSGAKIRTGHLKDKDAYTKYQGHEYQRMLIEELTQIPEELRYEMLIASCRSTIPELLPQIFTTTNPTGKGHAWVKARFVKVNGQNMAGKIWIPDKTGRPRLFIPATIEDNPKLMEIDPQYLTFLEGLPEHLKRAWRDGDWDVGAGQFFDTWREEIHEIKSFTIPSNWKKYISIDYGYSKPSSVHWHAINPSNGRVYTYKEIYVTHHTYLQLASSIARHTGIEEDIEWIVADSAIWAATQESGHSGADIMMEYFKSVEWSVLFVPSNKGPNSRVRGWGLMREYIKPTIQQDNTFVAQWYVFKNECPNLCREIRDAMCDEDNIEDLDTDADDHALDECRYFFQTLREGVVTKKKTVDKNTNRKKYGILTAREMFEKIEREAEDKQ